MNYKEMLAKSAQLYNFYLEKLANLPPIYSEEEFKKKCKLFHGELPLLTSTELFRRRFLSLLIYDIQMMLPDIVKTYNTNNDKMTLKLINDFVTKATAAVITNDEQCNIHFISLIRLMLAGTSSAECGEEFARISADFLDAYKKGVDDDTLIKRMSELITFMMTGGKSHNGIIGFKNNHELIYQCIGIQVTGSVSEMGSNLYDNFLMCNPQMYSSVTIENDLDIVGITCVKLFEFVFGVNMTDMIEKVSATA